MQTPFDTIPPTRLPRLARVATLAGGIALAALAGTTLAAATAPEGQMARDLATRDRDIHWPVGFEPENADLFAHNEALLDVPCESAWRHIVDVAAWPNWYPNARNVTPLDGATELAPAVRWRWTTFGLAIESRVHEFVPGRRLGWFGGASGEAPAFYHTWLLRPEGRGCRVAMDEAGIGAGAAAFREADEGRMHRGHTLWLETLRWISAGG
ncbi:SRPBCC family protein [Edaphosphingomonas haloaromaticamans]|uniref:Polyketide cyclase / dehydrase and lipid transport n=1 Tax=Edaphosphingomonas haloaromaticamans TaxID=653954 RepID=A0A1S1HAE1_9SPHN|nr:SRPBCC family protein [Sphingomonas haloaromaticamans]OHT19104.1 Polyketide cyclase / dehydrase and lipid transport [Sphingomonas haloaromaticamans]